MDNATLERKHLLSALRKQILTHVFNRDSPSSIMDNEKGKLDSFQAKKFGIALA
jgi:hypothetical protein